MAQLVGQPDGRDKLLIGLCKLPVSPQIDDEGNNDATEQAECEPQMDEKNTGLSINAFHSVQQPRQGYGTTDMQTV